MVCCELAAERLKGERGEFRKKKKKEKQREALTLNGEACFFPHLIRDVCWVGLHVARRQSSMPQPGRKSNLSLTVGHERGRDFKHILHQPHHRPI